MMLIGSVTVDRREINGFFLPGVKNKKYKI